jgi:catechol-2,3-dioxygenase
MSGIVELGHAGLWVDDLEVMKDFYSRVLGLTVTDEDPEIGMVFLSSRPDPEHHELVLARGRVAPRDTKLVNQLSWRLASLEDLVGFHERFRVEGVPVRQVVTHGIALGIYFEDPEGNVNEVYWRTPDQITQPFRKDIDLGLPVDGLLEESRRLIAEGGSTYRRAP